MWSTENSPPPLWRASWASSLLLERSARRISRSRSRWTLISAFVGPPLGQRLGPFTAAPPFGDALSAATGAALAEATAFPAPAAFEDDADFAGPEVFPDEAIGGAIPGFAEPAAGFAEPAAGFAEAGAGFGEAGLAGGGFGERGGGVGGSR